MCSPPGSPMPQSPSSSSASDSSCSDSTGSPSPGITPDLDRQSASSSSDSSSVPETYDGLRYRAGFPPYNPQSQDAAQVPFQGSLPANMAPNPMYVPLQMLWWQQMYARHYYMQYQAAVAAAQPPITSPTSSSHQPAQPDEAVPPPLGPNPAQNPLQENQPANQIQMNAQGGPVLNDDELNRDWLDWLYTVSRVSVLLSIVYFYSSFSRFIMVLGAMLLVYLHQARWFPFRLDQQNLQGGERAGAPQNEAQRQQDIQEMERLMDDGMEDDDTAEEGVGGPEDQAQGAAALHEPNILNIAWSFISTFFTSLIPEGWHHPAN